MRTIFIILRKEFKQIFRNRAMLPIIFVLPMIQLLILANAATFEMKNIKMAIIDNDNSSSSRLLTGKFEASNYFIVSKTSQNAEQAEYDLLKGDADLFLEIPQNFEKQLIKENENSLSLIINAVDGSKAAVAMGYSSSVINDFNREMLEKYSKIANISLSSDTKALPEQASAININIQNWFNPDLNYKTFMLPGILVLLVTLIGAFLSSMNIAREKEIGTIEQLNVTPIKKHQFIIGKLLPFWFIGQFELAFGMVLIKIIFDIPFVGSPLIIFSYSSIFLLVVLGLGLFISTMSNTQQQAMFLVWFCMVLFILLGGLFTAIENMPSWVQTITYFNPIRYFIEVIRMVMLKGARFEDVQFQFAATAVYAVLINVLAILRYRKTEG